MPLNLLGVGAIEEADGDVDKAALGIPCNGALVAGDKVLTEDLPNCEL